MGILSSSLAPPEITASMTIAQACGEQVRHSSPLTACQYLWEGSACSSETAPSSWLSFYVGRIAAHKNSMCMPGGEITSRLPCGSEASPFHPPVGNITGIIKPLFSPVED